MAAVKRRTEHIALARTGEKEDGDLDAARRPAGDPVAGAEAVSSQVGGEPIGKLQQIVIGEGASGVPDRDLRAGTDLAP